MTMAYNEQTSSSSASAMQRAGIPVPGYIKRNQILGAFFFALTFLLIPQFGQYTTVIGFILVFAAVGGSLVIAFGAAGQFTLGHSIFLGAGAFLSANIANDSYGWGRGLELEIPIALAVCFVLGLIVGLPSLRVNELYLALATFAIAYVGQQVLYEWKQFTAGGSGKPAGDLTLFGWEIGRGVPYIRLSLIILLIIFWICGNILDGKTGRSMNALRTSETAARSAGINVAWLKILAFGISGAITGLAGVLYIHNLRYSGPENFNVHLSILLILTLIIGGRHRLAGAIAGAIFVKFLPELIRDVQDYEGIIYGGSLILLTLFSPRGLIGLIESFFQLLGKLVAQTPLTKFLPKDTKANISPADEVTSPLQSATLAGLVTSKKRGHLTVQDARVIFGGVRAVDGVSFEVESGKITGVIGSNGAGKTTLFNAITGHAKNAEGHFILDGKEVSNKPIHVRSLAGLGRTFQNLNLHGDIRVLDHALIGLDRNMGYGRISEAFRLPHVVKNERLAYEQSAELLDHMELLEYWDEKVDDLPYGLQKRVDVTRGLATNPSILLLDEPAAGLPTAEALEMMKHVIEYAEHIGCGVIVIEHNVELVADVCERVIVMDAGKILADGTAESVMKNEDVIAAYLGT